MASWSDLRTRHRDELRDHVRRAAVELVVERGIAGASMSQLAQRSGVPRATVYTYYRTVEHALADWLDAEVGAFRAELSAVLAGLDDPLDRLGAYLAAQCRVFAGAGPGLGGAGAAAAGPPGP
ncbi:MAG: TetR family transcriptional regulator, partial [Pseudonocardia sp.]|nr:TetR family transcriptional regulator [Pseudonocardia sp.]